MIEVDDERRSMADYVVLVTGKSSKHLLVLADALSAAVRTQSYSLIML